MPLHIIPARKAVADRKANPLAGWSARGDDNRVEPVCRPGFGVPFRLEPGEAIFTIGSCFARNVELELERRGFRIPMRELFNHPSLAGTDSAALNNFGTPSIHNELRWALEEAFDPETGLVEVTPGKWADLHLVGTLRPEPREKVLARREAIRAAVASVTACRVVIVTLGLLECWYDRKSEVYLNVIPRPSVLKAEPERFELHVLSFDEAWSHLDAALQLLRRHGRPDLQVILSVSPVPLTATHRPIDVIDANTYSKSVLRAVAEHARAAYDFVTYFPSYESVILSDRQFAWKDDMVHVTEEIVALNVGRMVDAFAGAAEAVEGELAAVDRARTARLAEDSAFFEDQRALAHQFPAAALEFARWYANRDPELALSLLPEHADPLERAMVAADAWLASDQPARAAAALWPHATPRLRNKPLWEKLLVATARAGDVEGAERAERLFLGALPTRAHRIPILLSKAFRASRPDLAERYAAQLRAEKGR